MDVVSACPFPVASVRWMSAQGAPALTVVCRVTLVLQPIVARVADEAQPIVTGDVHEGDDPRRGLRAVSDLVPYKARADVVVTGHAFAPRGRPSSSVTARLVVGSVDKRAEVATDRPLSDLRVLGPLGVSAPERVARSRIGARWAAALSPDRPLPEDIDPAFFNSAPLDQQLDSIRPGERILLEHLHPAHPRLVTSLPGIVVQAEIARVGRASEQVQMVCDTLWIDTDQSLCALVFRTALGLAYPGEPGFLRVTAHIPDDDDAAGRTMSAPIRADLSAPPPFVVAQPAAGAEQGRPSTIGLGLPFLREAAPPAYVAEPARGGPIVSGPVEPTPWAEPSGQLFQGGSIGQRIALEQSMIDADAARLARPAGEVSPSASTPEEDTALREPREPAPRAHAEPEPAPKAALGAGVTVGGAPLAAEEPDGGAAGAAGREVLFAVWAESDLVAALRKDRVWRDRLSAVSPEDPSTEDELWTPLDDDDPRALLPLIARAEPLSRSGLERALARAIRPDDSAECPLAITEGVFSCAFDPRERLRVSCAAALALEPDDESLAAAVARGRAALSDGAVPARVLERQTTLVLAAYGSRERIVPEAELSAMVERALVEQRAYLRRDVLSGPHVRAELASGGGAPLVAYLPDSAVSSLPLARSLRARLLVEVRPREDDAEPCQVALRVRAVVGIRPVVADGRPSRPSSEEDR